jgi:hypothetical protein
MMREMGAGNLFVSCRKLGDGSEHILRIFLEEGL